MRRLIWPLLAGAVALWLALSIENRPMSPPGATAPPTRPMPAGRPIALTLLADGGFAVGGQGGGVSLHDADGRGLGHWMAHGGAVRRVVEVEGDLITVGDGSVARWSRSGERRWRRRLPEHTLNDVALLDLGEAEPAVFVAAERGSVARLGSAGWHRRGSHGRASFAVTPWLDGIASAGADGSIALWSPDGAERLRWSAVGTAWVTALTPTPRGLLAGGSKGSLTEWALDADGAQRLIWGVPALAFDGGIVAVAAAPTVYLVGTDTGWGALVDPTTPDVHITLLRPAPAADAPPLSAIALRGERAYALDPERRLRVWDVTNGEPLATLHLALDSDPPVETP